MNYRLVFSCVIVLLFFSGLVNAAETSPELQSAGVLYDKSVDLANAGKYNEALLAADQALSLNVSSLMPVIQANRAGILTVIGRYNEAIVAADASIASEGNLTTAHSIAWYNKGDALRHLGRIDEAKTAFAQAQALDPTLLPPKDLPVVVNPVKTTAIIPPKDTVTLVTSVPQNSSSSSVPFSLIILLIIGVVIVTGGYIWYTKMETPARIESVSAQKPKTPKEQIPVRQSSSQSNQPLGEKVEYRNEEESIKPIINNQYQNQNLREKLIELQNNPVVSPSVKSELNSILKGMNQKSPEETKESLQVIAEDRWITVNKNVIRLEGMGVIFSWSPDIIRQYTKDKRFFDAIFELETVNDSLTHTEDLYNEAKKLRKATPESEINELFNKGNYSELITRAREIQEGKKQIKSLGENAQRLFEEAEKIGSLPDSLKQNIRSNNSEVLKKVIEDLEEFNINARPNLTIILAETQLAVDKWHKVELQINNTGDVHASDIQLTLSDDFETRWVTAVTINAKKSETLQIGIKPKTEGNIPLEINAKYKNRRGKEYLQTFKFWINVTGKTGFEPSGTPSANPVSKFTPKPLTAKQLPPDLFDHYTESEFIGKGGFARVFKAKRKDGKFVAVKIPITMDAVTGKSFIAEMQNWTKLSHPNIVKLFDFNIMPMPYFEEELCDSALSELKKPIECEEAAWILLNVCEGLKFAHKNKIIHRDLKPQNILLKNGMPKISDWGLSRIVSESTSTTVTAFTPYYAAPEQINNRVKDERTDIWQLGVILYELVTSKLPFSGDSMIEIGMYIATKDPIPPREIIPGLKDIDAVVMKCLEKDPAKRYQSVLELQKDLALFLRENYTELLKTSVSVPDYTRSAYYCGDLVMINLLTGDIPTAYKYLLDLVHYSKGDLKNDARELSEQIKIRMEMGVTEIPDELILKAEIIVHQVSMGFRNRGR